MQTLDLECPSCGEHLELDAGFAGGVCRCSSCGTLMTVPREAGRAEQLTAPVGAGELSDTSAGSMGVGRAPRQRAGSRSRGGKRGKRNRPVRSATIEAGEYRTASGKVVRVDAPTRVPMAEGKRRQVRIVTTAVFLSVVLGVAVIAVIAVWAMLSSGNTSGTPDSSGEAADAGPPEYDPSLNPYDLEFANIAGLPLDGKVAIVTEATNGESEYWMPQAAELIKSGLRAGGSSAQAVLFAASGGETVGFGSGRPTPVGKISQGKLDAWFAGLGFADEEKIDRAGAIDEALKTRPDMLILIFSGGTDEQVDLWKRLIGEEDLAVHAVLIDSSSPLAMRQWLTGRDDSEFLTISSRELDAWKEVAGAE